MSCSFHLSPIVDLADNFNAFPTSDVNPSCSKLSFPCTCELVVTTKTRIRCTGRCTLYDVITQMVYCKYMYSGQAEQVTIIGMERGYNNDTEGNFEKE